MPFKSVKQRNYMKRRLPKIYRRWTKKYGSKPVRKTRVKKRPLYKPFKNTGRGVKKYYVYVKKGGKRRKIGFGDKRYRHNYSAQARRNYLKRSSGIRNKAGKLTKNDKNSANYWARRVLWGRK